MKKTPNSNSKGLAHLNNGFGNLHKSGTLIILIDSRIGPPSESAETSISLSKGDFRIELIEITWKLYETQLARPQFISKGFSAPKNAIKWSVEFIFLSLQIVRVGTRLRGFISKLSSIGRYQLGDIDENLINYSFQHDYNRWNGFFLMKIRFCESNKI